MKEKSGQEEIAAENELSRLRQELGMAEVELEQVKAERDQIMNAIIAGEKDAARNFSSYFEKLKRAEKKAIDALEAWGNAAAEFYKLNE